MPVRPPRIGNCLFLHEQITKLVPILILFIPKKCYNFYNTTKWRGNMKKTLLVLVLLLVACQPSAEAIQKAISQTQTAEITEEPLPTETLHNILIQNTKEKPLVSPTPKNTSTQKPTSTRRPTLTPEPKKDPIILTGSGSDVVDFEKWDGAALLHVISADTGYFGIWNYDDSGNKIDTLINTIAPYDGYKLIDYSGENSSRFEIDADGEWEIRILEISDTTLRKASVPGKYTGKGDDVIYLTGKADTAVFDCQTEGYFGVWSFSNTNRNLLINEIAPFNGKVIIGKDVIILEIQAPGEWTVEFKP